MIYFRTAINPDASVPDGRRIYQGLEPTEFYYLLVSNTDPNESFSYRLAIEKW